MCIVFKALKGVNKLEIWTMLSSFIAQAWGNKKILSQKNKVNIFIR